MDAKNMKTALTIAGSDSSGGAGIQADIKTMITNGVYAMSAITALTAQNTTGVSGIFDVTPEFLAAQLDAVLRTSPGRRQIGMVSSPALIEVILRTASLLPGQTHRCGPGPRRYKRLRARFGRRA